MTEGTPPGGGRTCVVTGAANGIGRALALRLAGLGYELLLVDMDGDGLESLASELPAVPWTVCADLSGHRGVEQVCQALGKLDRPAALVNNAGMYRGNPLHTYDVPTIERDYWVNVLAPMLLTQAYATPLVERGEPGCVVNLSSTAGEIGSSDAVYGSSKAAVIGLTKSQAMNYAPWVRVNCVSPGLVRGTAIEQRIPEYRHAEYARQEQLTTRLDADSVAEVIEFLISPASRNLTGKVLPVDNGAYPR
ncbi:MAG TPA: SDR family oxidoreductase [Jatrophihabitans sp.]|uniref:SDR family NAD(P)-dependent oxidoreductase n=1 Tax=Jatrophihabitans sp. TaxID=1932789 RepID=UPI002F1D62BC